MISIEQWRARIGLFNCKRVRTATPSSVVLSPIFSFLILISSQEPSQEHSSSTPPTTTNERPSPTSDTPIIIPLSPSKHMRLHVYTTCSSTSLAVAASTSSFSNGSGLFSLRRSVFRSVLMILVIAVISQLLVISGDMETNPGPRLRADAKPRLRDLQKMTYTDEDGTRVPFRLVGRMRPHVIQVAIALEFPQHNISIMT